MGKPKTRAKRQSRRLAPRTGAQAPKQTQADRPVFSFTFADRAHSQSWSWADGDEANELVHFLCDISKSSWHEIAAQQTGGGQRHRKHHPMPFEQLCPEAQARLSELRHDELFEEIYRFRLAGKKRLWGFRDEATFHILWWDRDHAVYPLD